VIQQAVQKLTGRVDLTRDEVAAVMREIADGQATPAQMAAFLIGLRMKGETAEEIAGAAAVMRERVARVRVRRERYVDTCGTGGDGSCTFNISTTAALVAAAAGAVVAKHGNRSVSSRCGSADVLEALGVNVSASPEVVERCIEELGIGFLFAPHHHPAFKAVAGVRKELGVRTVFNLLGPLANPALARRQVMGVFDAAWVPVIGQVLQSLGSEHALVVHGSGMDEITLSGVTRVCEVKDGQRRELELDPEALGLARCDLAELKGGDAQENARITRDVISGQKGPCRDVVLANAAAALLVGGVVNELREGVKVAAEAIDRGAAKEKLAAQVRRRRRSRLWASFPTSSPRSSSARRRRSPPPARRCPTPSWPRSRGLERASARSTTRSPERADAPG
jgi:anthranilate phosphoribosyltransferase